MIVVEVTLSNDLFYETVSHPISVSRWFNFRGLINVYNKKEMHFFAILSPVDINIFLN